MLDWAFAQSSQGICLLDTEMRYLRINNKFCKSMGLKNEAAGLGLRPTELFPELGFEPLEAAIRQVILTGVPGAWKGYGRAPGDTTKRGWRVSFSPVRDAGGQVCAVLATGLDVSEQRLAQKRLALVNEASNRIGSSLDVTRTGQELVDVAVPALADLVMIDLQDSVLRGDEPRPGPLPGRSRSAGSPTARSWTALPSC